MRSNEDKKRLLKTLVDCPWISLAAKRVGIDHSTIYRWMDKNPKFAKDIEDAIRMGRQEDCEFAEAKVMVLIQQGSFPATKFYLENNNPRYKKRLFGEMNPDDSKQITGVEIEIVRRGVIAKTSASKEALRVSRLYEKELRKNSMKDYDMDKS